MLPMSRYFVRRRNWRWSPGNEHTPRGWVCFPGPGTTVAEFDFFDDAEHDWGKREAAMRLKINPFDCGPLSAVTSFPGPILRDFLMDVSIEPPAPGIAWEAWWVANREQLSDEQQARLWQAVDKVRFFEISEAAVGPEVHVVVDVVWEEREGIHVADWDGGELIRACRHVQRAGEIARGRAQQTRMSFASQRGVDGVAFANCRPCNVPDPFNPGSTRLMRLPQVPFSEVLTIPLDETGDAAVLGPFSTDRLAVLTCLDYASGPNMFPMIPIDFGVPLKAFLDWEKAGEECARLDRHARAHFNPFSIAHAPELCSQRSDREWTPVDDLMTKLCRTVGIPECVNNEWYSWWAEYITPLPEAQRDPFWKALNLAPFYSIVSVAFEG